VFVELTPLLAGRTVLITVAKVDDKTLRVNVIPHGKADDNPALSTPLTYTGPPEELDAELGKHLAGYVQTHQQTASTLAEAKATMEAAAKASQKPPDKESPAMAAEPTSAFSSASPTPAEAAPSSASTGTLGLFPPTTPEPAPTQSNSHLCVFGGELPHGATDAQGIEWVVEVMKPASDYAAKKGVTLGIEGEKVHYLVFVKAAQVKLHDCFLACATTASMAKRCSTIGRTAYKDQVQRISPKRALY
jgi:PRTRC genetic system protein E